MAEVTCTIPGCDSPTRARNLCSLHYQRWRKRGSVDSTRSPAQIGIPEGHKRCTQCRGIKPLDQFYRTGGQRGHHYPDSAAGRRHLCESCHNTKSRINYEANRDHYRAVRAKRYRTHQKWNNYGITQADYELMLAEQHSLCAICSRDVPLTIDHCHTGGQVRGLLCSHCNSGLGMFFDDPRRLAAAVEYLARTAVPHVPRTA